MEALKESQDQKRMELASVGAGNLGNWGLSWAIRRDLKGQRDRSYGEVQARSPKRDSIGKGPKDTETMKPQSGRTPRRRSGH